MKLLNLSKFIVYRIIEGIIKSQMTIIQCESKKNWIRVKSLNTDGVSDRSRLGLEFMSRVNTIVRMVTIDRIYTVSSWPCVSTRHVLAFNTGR